MGGGEYLLTMQQGMNLHQSDQWQGNGFHIRGERSTSSGSMQDEGQEAEPSVRIGSQTGKKGMC